MFWNIAIAVLVLIYIALEIVDYRTARKEHKEHLKIIIQMWNGKCAECGKRLE